MEKHSERERFMVATSTQGSVTLRYSLTAIVCAFSIGITVGILACSLLLPGPQSLVSGASIQGELKALLDALKVDRTERAPSPSDTGASSIGAEGTAKGEVEAGASSKESGETIKLGAPSAPPPPLACIDCDITQLNEGPNFTIQGCPHLTYNMGAATLQLISEKKGGPVWISYVGDSVLRSPLRLMPRTLLGEAWESERRTMNKMWDHKEQAFCCGDITNLETCIYVRCGIDTAEEKVDLFVQSFFAENGNRSFCWSFRFLDFLEPPIGRDLETYMNHPVPPLMLALNGGLHHVLYKRSLETHVASWRNVVELLASINGPREDKDKTTIFIHTMTHINDTLNTRKAIYEKYDDAHVQTFNDGLDNLLMELGWPTLTRAGFRYVDSYGISNARGVLPTGDGVHYKGSYQTIVASVHLNLLLHPEYASFCGLPKVHVDKEE